MTTPTNRFTAAQISASVREIREPYQMESKVDSPDAPEPRIHFRLKPCLAIACEGVRCLLLPSSRYS